MFCIDINVIQKTTSFVKYTNKLLKYEQRNKVKIYLMASTYMYKI